jgi:site-specific DNA-cytosine methylase
MNIIGKPPEAITSYTPFEANDLLLRRYLKKKGYDVPYYQLDKLSEKEEIELSKLYGTIDFASAVPPCSALSQAAQRKPGTRGTCEVNDWMYKSAIFMLEKVQPKVYAWENAPGLYTNMGLEVRRRLIEIGKTYGYALTFYATNTLRHGLPQYRPRTFGIFYKGEYSPILKNYNNPPLHITEYLKQIPEEVTLQDVYMGCEPDITKFEITKYLVSLYGKDWRNVLLEYKHHLTTYEYLNRKGLITDFLKFQKALPDASEIVTKNIEHIIRKTAMGKNARINYRVLGLDRDYVYAVIGEMMGRQVHPTEDRLMNIREFMHLMGLPMDYELDGPKEYVKITQNVPVATTEDITKEIVAIINNEREVSTKSVLMQDNTKDIFLNKAKKLF